MAAGILAAFAATLVWGSAFLVWIHCHPTAHRFRLMAVCWLMSWPVMGLLLAYSRQWGLTTGIHVGLDIFHGCLCHLLAFFFLVECYYHVARSVTLRILTELLRRPGQQATAAQLMHDYNAPAMVAARLEDLAQYGYITRTGEYWRLNAKGWWVAQVAAVSSWICRSTSQKDRVT